MSSFEGPAFQPLRRTAALWSQNRERAVRRQDCKAPRVLILSPLQPWYLCSKAQDASPTPSQAAEEYFGTHVMLTARSNGIDTKSSQFSLLKQRVETRPVSYQNSMLQLMAVIHGSQAHILRTTKAELATERARTATRQSAAVGVESNATALRQQQTRLEQQLARSQQANTTAEQDNASLRHQINSLQQRLRSDQQDKHDEEQRNQTLQGQVFGLGEQLDALRRDFRQAAQDLQAKDAELTEQTNASARVAADIAEQHAQANRDASAQLQIC